MKRILAIIACITVFFTCACFFAGCDMGGVGGESSGSASDSTVTKTKIASVKVMSINIAAQDMETAEYSSTVKYPGQSGKDYSYAKRRERLDALIGEYTPDVLMLQEVNGANFWWPHLVSNEDSFLNTFTQYELVGRTNRNGQTDGAGAIWYDLYNQLYYNSEKFQAVATGMFWLNSKRTEPFTETYHDSAYFDPGDNATCVWAVLKDKNTGIEALYASTHLLNGAYLARMITNYRQAINLADGLYKLSEQYSNENGLLPIIVAGDFNASTDQQYAKFYTYLTESAFYSDARAVAKSSDTKGTARIWGKNVGAIRDDGCTSDGYRIDFIFSQAANVQKYRCLNGSFLYDSDGEVFYNEEPVTDGGGYDLSDHLPIYAEIKIPEKGLEVKSPLPQYQNTATGGDAVVTGNSEASVTQTQIKFNGTDILKHISVSPFFKAEIVSLSSGKALRLTATEVCTNHYAVIDYASLLKEKGLTAVDTSKFTKIKITFKTELTVRESEIIASVLTENAQTIVYGKNTIPLKNTSGGFTPVTYTIPSAGKISGIAIGTMAYASDFAGTCGLYAGDSIYISAIEFIA